jgi:hypothetical protein
VGTDERDLDDPDDRRPARRRRDDHDDEYDDRPHYERPHRGGMILAFGIISLVMCQVGIGIVFGILAWIFGSSDLKGMEEGEVDPEGKQLTQVGKILGIVGVILGVLYFVGIAAYFAFLFAFFAAMPKPAPPPVPAPAPVPPPKVAPAPPVKGALVLPAHF